MESTRTKLDNGVYLTYVPVQKFKTGLISAQFIAPIEEETAAARALLPAVLRRGTVRYPDMGALSAELDRNYGMHLDYTVRKKGESHCIGFVTSFIDDAYVPGGAGLLESSASLLGQIICAPVTRDGRFLPAYVEGERNNLVDAIRSLLNDKREYADLRLLQTMCAGEPYGVSRYGDEKRAAALTEETLQASYEHLLSTAPLELFYCGGAERGRVEDALRQALSALPRGAVGPIVPAVAHTVPETPKLATDEMDVTQGKLGIGFDCRSDDESAMMMGNTLFGGSSNSKLFMNVREKLSLCYYASSLYHRQKKLITVSSGIEFENYQKAYDEILCQLKAVQEGQLEDWEVQGAKSTLSNAYATIGDSQGKMENFWLGQAATERSDTPEELAREVREVTVGRIVEAMRAVTLDTVYFLKGKGAAE